MANLGNRTLVCSVLFMDIVGYSKTGVAEQVELKQVFNRVLASALAEVPPRERVLVDTGDGAAVTFLGDPQDALFVALAVLDKAGELPLRLGINLGPVSLVKDVNGLDNVVGDGINAAQRVMSFAGDGQLLVSRSFFEVISLVSKDYGALFEQETARTDKHGRAHELYAVTAAVRAAPVLDEDTPAQVFDAGTHFIVSARSQARVQEAVKKLGEQGCKLISPMTKVGAKWVASLDNPRLAVQATVEALGFTRVITGPTFEAVQLKLQDLLARGAVLVQDAELADGVWTAVCEKT